MSRIKSKLDPSLTLDQIHDLISDIRQVAIREIQLNADREAAHKKVDDRFATDLADLAALKKEKFAQVKAWSIAHPEAFSDPKTIYTVHGDFGFRTGMPALKFAPGFDEQRTLDIILARGLTEYVRTVQEIDKSKLIADRETIGIEKLIQIGVVITQANTFFLAPKIEPDRTNAAAA